jgi:hypothetical protein
LRTCSATPGPGPVINNGPAAKGLNPGFTLYEQFFRDAQTVVDAGDPVNYIAAAVARAPCSCRRC